MSNKTEKEQKLQTTLIELNKNYKEIQELNRELEEAKKKRDECEVKYDSLVSEFAKNWNDNRYAFNPLFLK